MRLGFAGDTAIPIFPVTPRGKPRAVRDKFVHVAPPSVDLCKPLPRPPDDISHGVRCACHVATYRMSGFVGSSWMSITPVESLTNSTLLNVRPPSVVLNRPRVGLARNGFPNTPRYATLEFRQSSSMLAMCSSWKPRRVQVRPPSVVFHRPSPCAVLPRMQVSPPPTQTTSGLRASTAMAPMVPPKKRSLIGAQVWPPSVVLKTPPPVVPIQYSLGLATEPPTATERPPRGGPTSRHLRPPKTAESSVIGAVGAGGTARVTGRVGRGGLVVPCAEAADEKANAAKTAAADLRMIAPGRRMRSAECRMQNTEPYRTSEFCILHSAFCNHD